jgi:membrane protease YdiL (CAAX protease family)
MSRQMSQTMISRDQAVSVFALDPNLPAKINLPTSICERAAAGRVTFTGPLLLVCGRSFLWMASQGLVALIFLARHHTSPWREATYWWSVCFTLADLACLAAMRRFTRREGVRIRDLFGPIRMRHGRDLFLGLGYYILVFPFFLGGGYLAQAWLYGSRTNPSAYFLFSHALPLWAVVYSFSIYWIIQSATEELTYQGYVLPRLEALTGRPWIAFALMAFWFTAQHCAIGFVPDWRSLACRFLGFLPGCMVMIAIYMRTRRLMPLIIAHWLIDIGAVMMTTL